MWTVKITCFVLTLVVDVFVRVEQINVYQTLQQRQSVLESFHFHGLVA